MTVTQLRAERWFEVEVRIPGQRPLRELVKATSKREAFEITYRRYNTTVDPDGHLVQRIGQAQVAVVDAAQRRLTPQPISRRRAAAPVAPQPSSTRPRLEGKTAFGNLQTGF
jgi:hypothetical protein